MYAQNQVLSNSQYPINLQGMQYTPLQAHTQYTQNTEPSVYHLNPPVIIVNNNAPPNDVEVVEFLP